MNSNTKSSVPSLALQLQQITGQALSVRARFGHVALLLAAVAMSIVLGALLATEPLLPTRTAVAFTVMLVMALSWMVYAIWVLRNRWTLLANHRIVAGRMAVAFSTVFTAAAFGAGMNTGASAGYLAAATGTVFIAASLMLLLQAHRRRAQLLERRRQLESELQGVVP
jgi:hypothetical protein